MKHIAIFAALLAATPALAQTTPAAAPITPPAMPDMSNPVTFVSAADVQTFIAESKAKLKPGQLLTGKPLLILKPYLAMLEYRVGTSYASIHPKEAEFFYVLAGGGTIVTGGTIADAKTRPDGNINGPSITGGTAKHLAPGDTLFVPEGVPHIFNQFDGALVLLSLKVPRAPAP
jgi:mannose-6-phosphate isomerase-like protein (cupin superfamily)